MFKFKRIMAMILLVLLLACLAGCTKTQKGQRDHECNYSEVKLEKDIIIWTAELLTAEKIDKVKVFDHQTYHEGESLFKDPLGYYTTTYKYMEGYRIWFRITNETVANNYWNKQAGYERYYCYCWDDTNARDEYVDKSEHVIETSVKGVRLVPITDGTSPRLEYHGIFKNVKECPICGEIEHQEESAIYMVLYYIKDDPNFKLD